MSALLCGVARCVDHAVNRIIPHTLTYICKMQNIARRARHRNAAQRIRSEGTGTR